MGLEAENTMQSYFTSYNDIGVHALMLKDKPRTEAYRKCLQQIDLKDKVVLDVGCGTGILSMFAAQCGARKVYAVEASDFSSAASAIVKANGLDTIVNVIHGRVEDVELPEQVDIIMSEWMGFYLLHESMLESVLVARDRWLKPGGLLLPSHAQLYCALVELEDLWEEHFSFWDDVYGLDMSVLIPLAQQSITNPLVRTVSPDQLLGAASTVAEFDLSTISSDDLRSLKHSVTCTTNRQGKMAGICFWFNCDFGHGGSYGALNTAPDAADTHWHQTVVWFPDRFDMDVGEQVPVQVQMTQAAENARQYVLSVELGAE